MFAHKGKLISTFSGKMVINWQRKTSTKEAPLNSLRGRTLGWQCLV
jgi:hypothetical protein